MSALSAAQSAPLPRTGGEETQHRRHIEIVASRDQRRARPKLLAAIVTVGGLFAILAAQLLLTIATSEGAYAISSLQTQQTELTRDQQVLQESLQILQAPQHLAAEAQGMGMVASASTAYLRLSDGAVLGAAVAATADSAVRTAADGTSLIPNALLAGVPLAGTATPESADATIGAAGAPAAAGTTESVPSDAPVGIPTPNTH